MSKFEIVHISAPQGQVTSWECFVGKDSRKSIVHTTREMRERLTARIITCRCNTKDDA